MRAGAGFNATAVAAPSAARSAGQLAWHSPVPYLFGGLAAMLGLIAFALLILACSYWKLSGYLEGTRDGGNSDSEGGTEMGGKPAEAVMTPTTRYEEKVVVIMAGEEKPTYIATPISNGASSFGDHPSKVNVEDGTKAKTEERKGAGNETRAIEQSHESLSQDV